MLRSVSLRRLHSNSARRVGEAMMARKCDRCGIVGVDAKEGRTPGGTVPVTGWCHASVSGVAHVLVPMWANDDVMHTDLCGACTVELFKFLQHPLPEGLGL